jgi:DNA-binding NarL/FixJ family response regulator
MVLTAWVEVANLAVLLACGVQAVVLKDRPLDAVIAVIRNIGSGEVYVDPACRQVVSATAASGETETALSHREQTVLSMIVAGLANKQIAGQLALSETAVKATVQRLFAKAGVRTRGQLVRVAIERQGCLA